MTLRLHITRTLPEGLLEAPAEHLDEVLPGPTLIHLPGQRRPALFVSILLHGNETTGLHAIQALLGDYRGRRLPRALSIFVGNVAAAAKGRRRLDGQADYNRVWSGHGRPEHTIMAEVRETMRRRGVFASVDIHNNSGLNPRYACVNRLEPAFLQLATLFTRTVVYFLRPTGVQSAAFAGLCPSVTIECGRPGEAAGIEHARRYLEACLQLEHIPEQAVHPQDIDLFHTVATVRIAEGWRFGFAGEAKAELLFDEGIERYNFSELPAGTALARVRRAGGLPVQAIDEAGCDVSNRFFLRDGDRLLTRRPVMPSMLTTDCELIRQDCLCYLMERYPLSTTVSQRP